METIAWEAARIKLTFSGTIYDNKYCPFRLAMEKEAEKSINYRNHELLKWLKTIKTKNTS
jgi:hypothetical protein